MEDYQCPLRPTGLQGVRVVNISLSRLASPGSQIMLNMCRDSAIDGLGSEPGCPGSIWHYQR